MPFTASEIARHIGGEVVGDGAVLLTGFAPADLAKAGDLTFAENENFFARAERSAASAILVDSSLKLKSTSKVLICVPSARIAFAKVLPFFSQEPVFKPGIHPTALVAASAKLDPTAHIGPYCVIGENVRIGRRTVLEGGNFVGPDSKLGEDVHIFPNVTIYPRTEIGHRVRIHSGTVIGADGFGYVLDSGVNREVPQIGNVVIGDDVEIGANVTVDRGTIGPTTIGRGTKIDNLVQIAHNVTIGENCIVVAQAGIAGSTQLGNYVVLGGQVGLAGHLRIGNHVSIGAKSGVMHNINDGERWLGYPAQPDSQTKRQMVALQKLPELIRRVSKLEKLLADKKESPKSL